MTAPPGDDEEVRIRLSCRPANAAEAEVRFKLDHYQQSLSVLEACVGGDSLVRHLRFELEALHALPPHGRHPLESGPPPPGAPRR